MSVPSAAALRVAVAGASGRMGQMLIEAVNAAPDCVLAGAIPLLRFPAVSTAMWEVSLVMLARKDFCREP